MSVLQNFSQPKTTINGYLPAVLKENKSGWVIEYYVVNPQTEILTRKQIKVNRIVQRYNKMKDARLHLSRMINTLNIKLAGGWNPFFEDEDARMFEKLSEVSKLFLSNRKKELRKDTIRSYESFISLFISWLDKTFPDIYASMFSHSHAVRYMDYITDTRNVGPATYNNNLKIARVFFNWMKERCYTKQNPFDQIKPKKKPQKKRVIIPKEIRAKIVSDLEEHENKEFIIVCMLIYNSLIRRSELKKLRISNVNLEKRYIAIPSDVAKNHKARVATLTPELIDRLKALNLERYPDDYFLFGRTLTPSKEMMEACRLTKEWAKLRKRLKLPTEMQLYSLRDTGIFDMLKSGIDDLSVMQHADHSSLDITTIYANHYDPNLIDKIYTQSPKF